MLDLFSYFLKNPLCPKHLSDLFNTSMNLFIFTRFKFLFQNFVLQLPCRITFYFSLLFFQLYFPYLRKQRYFSQHLKMIHPQLSFFYNKVFIFAFILFWYLLNSLSNTQSSSVLSSRLLLVFLKIPGQNYSQY